MLHKLHCQDRYSWQPSTRTFIHGTGFCQNEGHSTPSTHVNEEHKVSATFVIGTFERYRLASQHWLVVPCVHLVCLAAHVLQSMLAASCRGRRAAGAVGERGIAAGDGRPHRRQRRSSAQWRVTVQQPLRTQGRRQRPAAAAAAPSLGLREGATLLLGPVLYDTKWSGSPSW